MDLYEFLSFHVSIDLARLRDRKEKPSQGVNRARKKKNILLRRLRRAMKLASPASVRRGRSGSDGYFILGSA
jgi:hypothetical protein